MRPSSKLAPAIAGLVLLGGGLVLTAVIGRDDAAGPSSLPGLPGFGSYVPVAGCIEQLPEAIEEPQYRPDSLTLPEGSVPVRTSPDPAPGLHVVVYRVPVGLDPFVDHLLEAWPAGGWVLGRGEREAGEAETVFYLPDKSRYGQVRARSVYCDLEQTEVTLTIGEAAATAG